jgi:hypothetical protein
MNKDYEETASNHGLWGKDQVSDVATGHWPQPSPAFLNFFTLEETLK